MTRTDRHTWDLASSVGATVTWVAACRALAGLPIPPGDSLESLRHSIAADTVLP